MVLNFIGREKNGNEARRISPGDSLEKATENVALVEGIPAGTEIDLQALSEDIARRKPGRKGLSMRTESDECEILSESMKARLQVGQFFC